MYVIYIYMYIYAYTSMYYIVECIHAYLSVYVYMSVYKYIYTRTYKDRMASIAINMLQLWGCLKIWYTVHRKNGSWNLDLILLTLQIIFLTNPHEMRSRLDVCTQQKHLHMPIRDIISCHIISFWNIQGNSKILQWYTATHSTFSLAHFQVLGHHLEFMAAGSLWNT